MGKKEKKQNWMCAVPIQPHQQWRLQGSPADRNDYYKLELPGAWEPTGSECSH